MAGLSAYTSEEVAEALFRLAEFASGGATQINKDTYAQALSDLEIAQAFLRAYKQTLDSCSLPCAVKFDAKHRELVVTREAP